MRPDVGEALYGVARVTEYNALEKMEFPFQEAFQRRFYQVAAIGRKVCLGVGYLPRRPHEAERQGARSMDKRLRNERAEESDGHTVLGQQGRNVTITPGGYVFDLFPDPVQSGSSGHRIELISLNQICLHLTTGEIKGEVMFS